MSEESNSFMCIQEWRRLAKGRAKSRKGIILKQSFVIRNYVSQLTWTSVEFTGTCSNPSSNYIPFPVNLREFSTLLKPTMFELFHTQRKISRNYGLDSRDYFPELIHSRDSLDFVGKSNLGLQSWSNKPIFVYSVIFRYQDCS